MDSDVFELALVALHRTVAARNEVLTVEVEANPSVGGSDCILEDHGSGLSRELKQWRVRGVRNGAVQVNECTAFGRRFTHMFCRALGGFMLTRPLLRV